VYSLGLDIGTSHIKALLLDEERRQQALATMANPTGRDGAGRAVYTPQALWERTTACARACLEQAGVSRVAHITVSAMGEAGVLLDKQGAPLADILPWNDRRALGEVEVLRGKFSAEALYAKTGQPLHPKYPLPRFLWMGRPLLAQAWAWLPVGDYLVYRLTGETATDYTQASRTGCFDITARRWDPELLAFCGAQGLMPPVYPMGTAVGPVRREALVALGLTGAAQAHLGGHDHVTALWACGGAGDAGNAGNAGVAGGAGGARAFNSCGTSEVFAGVTAAPRLTAPACQAGVAQGAFSGDAWYWMSSLPSSGASLGWFSALVGLDYPALARLAPRGLTTQVLYLPFLNGRGTPRPNPAARGQFLNLGPEEGREALLKAIYEGVAFQGRLILETLAALGFAAPASIHACGGGVRNRVWQGVKADIFQKPLVLYAAEMCALGAALLPMGHGVGAGVKGAAEWTAEPVEVLLPSQGLREYYEEKYGEFLRASG
jgi:xylulokinase